ncbi:PGRS family protein [Sorangium sp. So ce1151]|uniref:PGRS family protein n=1 Tax=Sorangium sp. So ce1151 TaxID=3133332 RepID=UPI003F641E29
MQVPDPDPEDPSEPQDPPDPPDPTGPVVECVPREATGGVDGTCGVFVSASRSGSDGSGAKNDPLGSLQQAIALAQQNGTGRVYACAGDGKEFNEAVEVPGGVTIFGGLDCRDDWKWVGDAQKTILTAEVGKIPLTMRGLPGAVHIEDVRVVAQPTSEADDPGLSSIAAIALSSAVELVRCELEAGDAGQGADGAPLATPVMAGAPGQPGGDACSRNDSLSVAGGGAVTNDCGTPDDLNDDSSGGRGGNGRMTRGDDGSSGTPLVSTSSNDGQGGTGDKGEDGDRCMSGATGSSRSMGTPGAGARGPGTISMDGYAGVSGALGSRGAQGQGGGGGGGRRGVSETTTVRSCPDGVKGRSGAAGGSGGTGGCGGLGGRGGAPGGASIALISIDAALSFDDVTLKAGNAGNGGNGGDGQPGGDGAEGGPGGRVPAGAINMLPGCNGGKGGTGGTGGRGGGGQGGHSLGIAFRGSPPPTDGVTIQFGAAGASGEGDDPDQPADAGIAMDALEFN